MSPAKTSRKTTSTTETEMKKRNVSLTGLSNFLNEQYATSVIADDVRLKFKPVPRNPSKKFNLDTVSKVSVTKCPGLNEFITVFNKSRDENQKAAPVDVIRKNIFDFDARATLDIVNEFKDFDKTIDGHSILVSRLMRNLDLPHYKPVKAVELCDLIDKYFNEGLYKIKLINQIYPHAVRNAEAEAKHGVNTIYLQHTPVNTTLVLEQFTDGKDVEDIVKAVHQKIIQEHKSNKTLQTIIKQEKIVAAVLDGKGAELKFDELIPSSLKNKTFTPSEKRDIKNHIRDCVRELSRTRTLVNTITNGMKHNNYSLVTDAAQFLSKYKDSVERFNDFAESTKRYNRNLSKDFLAYFVDTIQLCFDVFGIIEKEKKSDFVRQFISTIDSKKRIRFNDTFKNELVADEFDPVSFVQNHMQDAEKLVGDCCFETSQLSKFLNNFGKSCISVKRDDRLSRSTYIAMALTVIRYVQSEIRHILADKVKSREITIYLVE